MNSKLTAMPVLWNKILYFRLMGRLILFFGLAVLLSACSPDLRQDGMRSRLSLGEGGDTFFRADSNRLFVRLIDANAKVSLDNIWLLAEFSSGSIKGLPLSAVAVNADRSGFDLGPLLRDTTKWYSFGRRRITTLSHTPTAKRKSTVKLSEERYITLSLHVYERKKWTQDRPQRIAVGESAYQRTSNKQITLEIGTYRDADGQQRLRCNVHNKNLDGLHFYTDPGLPRITLYARGEGKAGIHTLTLLPPFFETQKGMILKHGDTETVLDVSIAHLMREDERWEWYRGNKRTRPDQVSKPRRVNSFYFWFSAASVGTAFYSPEVRVLNDL